MYEYPLVIGLNPDELVSILDPTLISFEGYNSTFVGSMDSMRLAAFALGLTLIDQTLGFSTFVDSPGSMMSSFLDRPRNGTYDDMAMPAYAKRNKCNNANAVRLPPHPAAQPARRYS